MIIRGTIKIPQHKQRCNDSLTKHSTLTHPFSHEFGKSVHYPNRKTDPREYIHQTGRSSLSRPGEDPELPEDSDNTPLLEKHFLCLSLQSQHKLQHVQGIYKPKRKFKSRVIHPENRGVPPDWCSLN